MVNHDWDILALSDPYPINRYTGKRKRKVFEQTLMSLLGAFSIGKVGKDAAGIAGNIFAFGLFVSPIPTFRRIVRNGSTEMFSGLPYIYSLLNCLICLWYGTPLISPDNLLVTTVNSIGAAFQLVYIILFLMYAENAKKVRMLGLLLAVFGISVIILVGSLQIDDSAMRRMLVGFLSCASLISMFASPLFIIKLVIRTKSVEYMPFYLSLSTFLMSTSFFLYGVISDDAFIYVPNGIGTVLGMIQLVLYFYYKCSSTEDCTEPLIVSKLLPLERSHSRTIS
ncbi:Bidirectional sugar transporter SWEET2, partial [Mucuna pruriens]